MSHMDKQTQRYEEEAEWGNLCLDRREKCNMDGGVKTTCRQRPKEYLSDQCLHSYSHPGVFCCSYMKYNDDMSMYTFLAPLCLPLISCVNIIATVTCNYCL